MNNTDGEEEVKSNPSSFKSPNDNYFEHQMLELNVSTHIASLVHHIFLKGLNLCGKEKLDVLRLR